MTELDYMQFKVLYRPNGSPRDIQEDWVCRDLKELMNTLKGQGVTKETTQFLYVHYTPANTSDVLELVAWKSDPPSGTTTPVKAAEEKTAKPRIRLKSAPVERTPDPVAVKRPPISSGIYTAYGE